MTDIFLAHLFLKCIHQLEGSVEGSDQAFKLCSFIHSSPENLLYTRPWAKC